MSNMLHWKVASVLRNIVSNSQSDVLTGIRMCKQSTAAVQSIQPAATPDKLYRKIELELRGNDPAVLKSYGEFATITADKLGLTISRNHAPHRAHHHRYTLLKSIHVYKKHRVQYEVRTYYRFIDFDKLTGSTADTVLEYLERNLPEGVALKVTKTELMPLLESVSQAPTISTT